MPAARSGSLPRDYGKRVAVADTFGYADCTPCLVSVFFFFQAEDGIRDVAVTGVQTCALPICQAAAAAIERIRKGLDAALKTQPLPETRFSLVDQWQRRLFLALCRRHGLEPYRYKGQRYTTVVVRAPRAFVERTLWPEYLALQKALHSYLDEATERIIREEVCKDADEAAERSG